MSVPKSLPLGPAVLVPGADLQINAREKGRGDTRETNKWVWF